MILLPCPGRTDLDCIAGAIGYAEYLQRAKNLAAKLWLCGTPDGEAQFYLNAFPGIDFADESDLHPETCFILVDFSAKDFLPDSIDPEKVIEVIDHRFFTQPNKDFPNARIQLDPVGAAATQIAEYFMRDNIAPSHLSCCLLYGAISSQTLLLKGDLCTSRDRDAAAWLLSHAPEASDYVAKALSARRDDILSSFPAILKTEMKIENGPNGQYGISQLEMTEGRQFWDDHKAQIEGYLRQFTFPVFLNIIDLSTNQSIFYATHDPASLNFFSSIAIEERNGGMIRLYPALMRKQWIPLINHETILSDRCDDNCP